MTQEAKQLLLKDLSARLPYGVKGFIDGFGTVHLKGHANFVTDDIAIEHNGDVSWIEVNHFKPYLRPMLSMTEKEKKEHDFYCGYKPYDENIGESYLTEYDMPDYIDFLYEHHLDFCGLIPMGLALEAPEGMYKNE